MLPNKLFQLEMDMVLGQGWETFLSLCAHIVDNLKNKLSWAQRNILATDYQLLYLYFINYFMEKEKEMIKAFLIKIL